MIPVTAETAVEVAQAVKRGELPGPAKSLAEAVCRVMEQVGYVQKDKQMQGGGSYRYVSVEAVIDALRPEMIRQQLVMLPSAVEPVTVETFEGKNGGRQNRTQVKYTFTLTHAPTGQTAPVVVLGEAIDVGDKSSNKAMTAARKYALIMAFNIETGIDPDDTPSHSQERAPEQKPAARQVQQIADARQQRAASNGSTEDDRYAIHVDEQMRSARSHEALAAVWNSFQRNRVSEPEYQKLARLKDELKAKLPTTTAAK